MENEMTNYHLYILIFMFCTFHAQKLCIFSCPVTLRIRIFQQGVLPVGK
jgi:hypothetical protein